jgi:hypothetical protein
VPSVPFLAASLCLATDAEVRATPLTSEGLAFLCVSVGGILVLVVWSYRRLLRLPPPDQDRHDLPHGP